jgi:hypothetical protein
MEASDAIPSLLIAYEKFCRDKNLSQSLPVCVPQEVKQGIVLASDRRFPQAWKLVNGTCGPFNTEPVNAELLPGQTGHPGQALQSLSLFAAHSLPMSNIVHYPGYHLLQLMVTLRLKLY